jgi:hypothetical protein
MRYLFFPKHPVSPFLGGTSSQPITPVGFYRFDIRTKKFYIVKLLTI